MPRTSRIAFLGGSFNPVHEGHIKLGLEAIKAFDIDKLILIPNANPPHKKGLTTSFYNRVQMLNCISKKIKNVEVSCIEEDESVAHYTYNTLEKLHKLYKNSELYFIIGTDSLYSLHTWYRGFELLNLANLICIKREDETIKKEKLDSKISDFIAKNAIYVDKRFKAYTNVQNSSALSASQVDDKDQGYSLENTDKDIKGSCVSDISKVYTQKSEGALEQGRSFNHLYMLNTSTFAISSTKIRDSIKTYYQKGNDVNALMPISSFIDKDVLNFILEHNLYRS